MKMQIKKIFFFPTRNCNLRCCHCVIVKSEKVTQKVLQVGTRIIEGLVRYHGEELRLAGGEPTIVPDLPILISEANRKGIIVSVITNGYQFNNNWIKALSKTKKNRVWFSIYGINQEMHDFVTNMPGSFQTVSEKISCALIAGLHVGFNVPITKHIIRHIEDLLIQAKALKISTVKFLRITPPYYQTEKTNSILPTEEEIEEFLNMKMNFRKIAERILLRFPSTFNKYNYDDGQEDNCFIKRGVPQFTVDGSGDVYPCCLYTCKKYAVLGNILSDSWEETFESYQLFRYSLIKRSNSFCPCLEAENINIFCPIAFTNIKKEETFYVKTFTSLL